LKSYVLNSLQHDSDSSFGERPIFLLHLLHHHTGVHAVLLKPSLLSLLLFQFELLGHKQLGVQLLSLYFFLHKLHLLLACHLLVQVGLSLQLSLLGHLCLRLLRLVKHILLLFKGLGLTFCLLLVSISLLELVFHKVDNHLVLPPEFMGLVLLLVVAVG
jgi:hypothetical protein